MGIWDLRIAEVCLQNILCKLYEIFSARVLQSVGQPLTKSLRLKPGQFFDNLLSTKRFKRDTTEGLFTYFERPPTLPLDVESTDGILRRSNEWDSYNTLAPAITINV